MNNLPKIAQARLRANAEAAAKPFDQHPDANLLAAFAEHTLTEPERNDLLTHLNHCQECRQVVALLAPEVAQAAVVVPAAPPKRSPWFAWRWGTVVATLAVLMIVVVSHSYKRTANSVPSSPAMNQMAKLSAPEPATPVLQAPPESKPAKADVQHEAEGGGRAGAPLKKADTSAVERYRADNMIQLESRHEKTMMAAARPPMTLSREAPTGMSVHQSYGMESRSVAAPAPPPPPPAAPPPGASTEEAKGAPVENQPSADQRASAASGIAGGAMHGLGSMGALRRNAAKTEPLAKTSTMADANDEISQDKALSAQLDSKRKPPALFWGLSAKGEVQRSRDGGATFENVELGAGKRFKAIAASGNEIWVVGDNGYIEHSRDGGAVWQQVEVRIGGNLIEENFTAVVLHAPLNLTLTTASGRMLTTTDGGQHWEESK